MTKVVRSCLSVCMSVLMSVCFYLCISVYLSISIHVCLSVCLSVCLCVCLFIYQSVSVSVYLYLSVHIPIYLILCWLNIGELRHVIYEPRGFNSHSWESIPTPGIPLPLLTDILFSHRLHCWAGYVIDIIIIIRGETVNQWRSGEEINPQAHCYFWNHISEVRFALFQK